MLTRVLGHWIGKSGCAESDCFHTREFGAILGSCVVLRIAQSFFKSEPEALDIEAESWMSLAARALAEAHFGQSLAIWTGAPQKRHRFFVKTTLPFLLG